jgi:butyrate kinase
MQEITQEIVNTGAVLAYIKTQDSYYQMPVTFYPSSTYSTSIEVETKFGGVSIYWTDSDRTTPINPGSQTFKIIVIASSDRIKKNSIDVSDYEQVISELNL